MAEVYSTLYCNIAAAASSDGTLGCFRQRSRRELEVNYLDISHNGIIFTFMSTFWPAGRYSIDSMLQGSLYQRAWVVQEVVLAPRTLHYWHDRLIWVCKSKWRDESIEGEINSSRLSALNFFNRITDHSRFDSHGGDRDVALRTWCKIVEHYSGSLLTYPENDKLVAVQGIADEMGARQDYIFGLWKYRLELQLRWRINPGDFQKASAQKLRFPSWTWASVQGRVSFEYYATKESHLRSIFKVIEIQSADTDRSKFECESVLLVESSLTCMYLMIEDTDSARECCRFQPLPEKASWKRQKKNIRHGNLHESWQFSRTFQGDVYWDSADHPKGGSFLYLCYMGKALWTYKWTWLVLLPSRDRRCFTRCGLVEIREVDLSVEEINRICKSSEGVIDAQPEIYVEKVQEKRSGIGSRYVFKIG